MAVATAVLSATPLFAGNIVLTGHDSDLHSFFGSAAATAQLSAMVTFARDGDVTKKVLAQDGFPAAPMSWMARSRPMYPYFPMYDSRAEARVQVTPRESAVYVDGFYAGIADDFDGFFQRLPLPPGPHLTALYLPGYRTVQHNVYLRPAPTTLSCRSRTDLTR